MDVENTGNIFSQLYTEPMKNDFNGLTDIETAVLLFQHIEEPCGMKLENGREVNIRQFYLDEAREKLKRMKNPFARELLKDQIEKYEKNDEF